MPSLLVSVRNLEEAEAARLAGVDLVDLKEPGAGALGAISQTERKRIAEHWYQLAGNAPAPPLSVALGELFELGSGEVLSDETETSSRCSSFRFAKVGLAGTAGNLTWTERWRDLARRLPQPTSLVAAAYADAGAALAPEPEVVLELALAAGAEVFLLDTYAKNAGSVFEQLPTARLASLRERARGRLQFALAGSVQEQHAAQLRELAPEIVAVRGAVCQSGRSSSICPHRLQRWRELTRGW